MRNKFWSGIFMFLLIAGGAAVWFGWQSRLTDGTPTSGDMPTTVRIPGGMLEVVTIKHGRSFDLPRPTRIGPFEPRFCPETARIDLTASFTYRVRLAETFPASVNDGKLQVTVPGLEPSLPVAWDTKTLRKRIDKCWLMPGRNTMNDLEHDISRRLEKDAKGPVYISYAKSNGAKETVKEFVRTWLQKQTQYDRLPKDIPIEVIFAS